MGNFWNFRNRSYIICIFLARYLICYTTPSDVMVMFLHLISFVFVFSHCIVFKFSSKSRPWYNCTILQPHFFNSRIFSQYSTYILHRSSSQFLQLLPAETIHQLSLEKFEQNLEKQLNIHLQFSLFTIIGWIVRHQLFIFSLRCIYYRDHANKLQNHLLWVFHFVTLSGKPFLI